jgi:hypothetical protein
MFRKLSGQMSINEIFKVGKCPSSKKIEWAKVPVGKNPSGQMSGGQMSVGKCPWANVQWANVYIPPKTPNQIIIIIIIYWQFNS